MNEHYKESDIPEKQMLLIILNPKLEDFRATSLLENIVGALRTDDTRVYVLKGPKRKQQFGKFQLLYDNGFATSFPRTSWVRHIVTGQGYSVPGALHMILNGSLKTEVFLHQVDNP